ncbi:MAG TPA: ATP-binding protein [Chloroflexota bacterium]|jgi:signal transduction histidine kinase|nr:ATP-binding protein [Chloroflexota bacterium]
MDGAEMRRLNASLRDALELQRRFVAEASHELRTPVASLRAQLDVLRAEASRPPLGAAAWEEVVRRLDDMARETARMSALLADLMTLAHADGGAPLARADVNLEEVLLDVYRETRPLATTVDFRLTLDERAASAPLVAGDRERLRQLFLNLVTNALRFTPDGGRIELRCRVSEREAAIGVTDTGIGIPAEDLPRIFERFYRADRGRARQTGLGGSGLGLAIAKWIAETHGGAISVESKLGAGTAFTVRLPLIGSPFAAPARSATRAATAAAR